MWNFSFWFDPKPGYQTMDKKDKLLIPEIPKGFQDRWGYNLFFKKKLLNIIEKNFIKYGYSPLETSPMEYSSIIGNSLADDDENPMADIYTFEESGKGLSLRYDLSQSCIRFYKQNYMDLPNPFKRYQIGTVFRREKPGNGRYKSFDQCDADVIGNFDTKQANVDLCNLIANTFLDIGLKKSDFVINVSNRKIVQGLLTELNIVDQQQKQRVLRAIDKLDKPGFGIKGVEQLLKTEREDSSGAITKGANLDNDQASQIINFLEIKDLQVLKNNFKNPLSQEGIKDLEDLFDLLSYGEYSQFVKLDLSKIRGLDIYTGFIVETNLKFEVKNLKGKIVDPGACASGGEYLVTKYKGGPFLGSGISIGVDRLAFCLLQNRKSKIDQKKPVLVCVMSEEYLENYYEILKILRENNISSEIFLDSKKKLSKQLDYANRRELNFAIICGENEFKNNTITIKKLQGIKGDNQISIPKNKLINEIKKLQQN